MARRTYYGNISDPRLILFVILLASLTWIVSAALTAAVYGPPLILLCGLLYNEFREHQRHTLLTSDETRNLSAFEAELREIRHRLNKIEEEGFRLNLKLNIDGSYYRGSRRGPELNNEREQLWDRESKIVPYTRYLRRKPLVSLDSWIHIESLRRAWRLACVVYVAIVLSLYVIAPASLEGISLYVSQRALVRFSNVNLVFYGTAIVTGVLSAFLLAVSYVTFRMSLRGDANEERKRLEEFAAGETEPPSDENDEEVADEEDDQSDENNASHEEDQPRRGGGDTGFGMSNGSVGQETCYEVLGVSSGTTREEIEAAWRRKIKLNHPDRVAELDPALQALAEKRSKQLNAARQEALSRL